MAQKYIVCAVRDKQAGVFGQPFCVPAVGLAVRGFSDQVNRRESDNPLNRHPEDFELYRLGSYDDTTGEFSREADDPARIARAVELIVSE